MKRSICVIAAIMVLQQFLGAITVSAATNQVQMTQDEMDDLYAKAVIMLSLQQYDEAEKASQQLLRQAPKDPRLIHLQRNIKLSRETDARSQPQRASENQLKQLILPEVKFREAQPAAVVDWLRTQSGKLTPDKTPLNFVWMVPDDVTLSTVTLSLKKVPMLDVLRYATQAAGLKYRIEPHAIVIYQPEPSSPPKADVRSE